MSKHVLPTLLILSMFVLLNSCTSVYTKHLCAEENLENIDELVGKYIQEDDSSESSHNVGIISIINIGTGTYKQVSNQDDDTLFFKTCRVDKTIVAEIDNGDEGYFSATLEMTKGKVYIFPNDFDINQLVEQNIEYTVVGKWFKVITVNNGDLSKSRLLSLMEKVQASVIVKQ